MSDKSFAIILFSGVALLFGLCWVFLDFAIGGESTELGQFGDKFGFVNALFSGLAFAGLIYTIVLQRKELELQRLELQETRKELSAQTRQFEIQNSTIKKEQFESTFFSLLQQHQMLVNDLYLKLDYKERGSNDWIEKSLECHGRGVFKELLTKRPQKRLSGETHYFLDIVEGLKEEKYGLDYTSKYPPLALLDHYFRNLYRLVKFVDENPYLLSLEDKYQYTSIVRSMLSAHELALLFYNCLSYNGNKKFKPLVEKYALLKNIDFSLVREQDVKLYDDGAYTFKYWVKLSVPKTRFFIKCIAEGEFMMQLDVTLHSNFGDSVVKEVVLCNDEAFTESKTRKELKSVNLLQGFRCAKGEKLIDMDFSSFKTAVLKYLKEEPIKTELLTVSQYDDITITYADYLFTIREQDGYTDIPSIGWSLKITYQSSREVVIPLELEKSGVMSYFS